MRRGARAFATTVSAVLCAATSLGAASEAPHPLHTTLVQLLYTERTRVLEGSIRVFAGDFASAVAKHGAGAALNDDRVADAAAYAYVSTTFRVRDANGRAVALAWCGSRRVNDLLWLCVRAANAAAPSTLMLSDQMLCELFDDQINIVQTVAGDEHASMLFTKGDGPKRILR